MSHAFVDPLTPEQRAQLEAAIQELKNQIGREESYVDDPLADVRPGAGGAASGAAVKSRELGAFGAEARRAGRVGAVF